MPRNSLDTASPAKATRSARGRTGSAIALHAKRENLEESTYRQFRSLILARSIRPGDKIDVDRVAVELGISRTPVVTALKRLGQEGVVELRPRRGIYVRRFSRHEMLWLFQVREVLEGLAARLAATQARREVNRLFEIFQEFHGELDPAAIQRYIERDRYFHWRVVELAGNQLLARTMSVMSMLFFTYQDGLVRPPQETLPEHLAVLEALRAKNPVRSEAAMRLHIRRSSDQLQRLASVAEALQKGGLRKIPRRPTTAGRIR
jgi:DNA-binding GntR family transcriptional regulator